MYVRLLQRIKCAKLSYTYTSIDYVQEYFCRSATTLLHIEDRRCQLLDNRSRISVTSIIHMWIHIYIPELLHCLKNNNKNKISVTVSVLKTLGDVSVLSKVN